MILILCYWIDPFTAGATSNNLIYYKKSVKLLPFYRNTLTEYVCMCGWHECDTKMKPLYGLPEIVYSNNPHLIYFCSIKPCFAYCPPRATVCGHTVRIKGLWDQTLVLSKWISHREGSRWTEREDTGAPLQTDFQWATAKTERKKLTTVNYVLYKTLHRGNMLLF